MTTTSSSGTLGTHAPLSDRSSASSISVPGA